MLTRRATLREYLLGGGSYYSSRYRIIEVASVGVFFSLAALLASELFEAVQSMALVAWLTLPGLIAGYVAADFASGFVHWLADTYAEETTPFVGPKFVKPFREHHADPSGITRHDFVEANGDNCLFALIPLVPTVLFVPVSSAPGWAFCGAFALTLAVGTLLTSVAHGWAHMPVQGPVVAWLQQRRLVLSPEHHARHHEAPFDCRYCITTGWLNDALDKSQFFRRAERCLAWFGIHPGSRVVDERGRRLA